MVKMKDIARRAGVSTATVSHVINNTRYVSKETSKRVIRAMEELNYQPNFAARSLRTKRTKIVGLLLTDVNNLFYMDIVEGIDSVFSKGQYNLIVSNSKNDIKVEQNKIGMFSSQLIDGLIMRPTLGDHGFLHKYSANFPIVFLDCKPNNFQADTAVLSDNIGGAYEATAHLINAGHRKIGLINGVAGETTSEERFAGYKQALADNGLDLNPDFVLSGDYQMMSGYNLTKRLLTTSDITALFVANNVMTTGALRYIQEAKVRIPEHLSLIGFDDTNWASLLTPPLTVVRQRPFEMGATAAKILLQALQEEPRGEIDQNVHRLSTELVVRQSVKDLASLYY